MTRKRFIKCLMATRMSRNDAVRIAETVPMFGRSYLYVYQTIFRPPALITEVLRTLAAEVAAILHVLSANIADALCSALVPEEGGDG